MRTFKAIVKWLEDIRAEIGRTNTLLERIYKAQLETKNADLEAKAQIAKLYRFEREAGEREINTVPEKPSPFDDKF